MSTRNNSCAHTSDYYKCFKKCFLCDEDPIEAAIEDDDNATPRSRA